MCTLGSSIAVAVAVVVLELVVLLLLLLLLFFAVSDSSDLAFHRGKDVRIW